MLIKPCNTHYILDKRFLLVCIYLYIRPLDMSDDQESYAIDCIPSILTLVFQHVEKVGK